jgi:hypothetical protein
MCYVNKMSKCQQCGIPTRKSTRNNKALLYCSKKCAQKWYHQKNYTKKNPDWGLAYHKEKAARAKRKEEYKWYKDNWLTIDQVATQLSISKNAAHHRIKTANVKLYVYKGGANGNKAFINPVDIEKLRPKETQLPIGYVTQAQAAAHLNVSKATFSQYRREVELAYIEWQDTHGNKSHRYLFARADLDDWVARVRAARDRISLQNAAEKSAAMAIVKEKRHAQEAYKLHIAVQQFKKQTAGMVSVDRLAFLMGIQSAGTHAENIPHVKLKRPGARRKQIWFKEEDANEYAQKYKEKKEISKAIAKQKKANRIVKRKDDWTSNESYENKYKRLAELEENKDNRSFIVNKALWKAHEAGQITFFLCNICNKEKAYFEFFFASKKGNKRGRTASCKTCVRAKPRPATKKPKTRIKFASQFITAIKRDISKRNNNYFDITAKELWKELHAVLGLSRDEILDGIEKKFLPWMNWANNGRPKTPEEPMWQLDHVKPKHSFNYTKITDPEFAECWGLNNLQPLPAVMNLIKSDKDLRSRVRSLWIKALKSGKDNKLFTLLPYTAQEARNWIESNWEDGMSWENFGDNSGWCVDHVVPQAYLSYCDTGDANFIDAWALENLRPSWWGKNSAKNSRFDQKLWFYNNLEKL